MKIKAIERILKASKRLIIAVGRSQWLTDGRAYYPIENIELNTDALCTMFDIPEDDRSKYYIGSIVLPEGMSEDDTVDNEVLVETRNAISINYGGEALIMLEAYGIAIFIPAKWLSPYKDEDIQLYARMTEQEHIYLAAKAGMFLIGLFVPKDVVNEDFVQKLKALYYLSESTLIAANAAKQNAEKEEECEGELWN